MKFIVMAIAASCALVSLPALAADQTATGTPVQLAQKADKGTKAGKGKSNKSGAARGDTHSDQVQDMNKAKRQ